MPQPLFSLRLLAIAFFVVAGLYPLDRAHGYHRRYGNSYNYAATRARQQQAIIQAALAQRNAAQQVLDAAQSTGSGAQEKLNSALSKLRQEAQQFHDSQSTTRQAAKDLAEIEDDILEEQTADSPYKQAVKKVEAARQSMKATEERALSDSAVQSKLAGLSGSSLVDAKNKILEYDENYLGAKSELAAQGSAVSRIRSELFQADAKWKEAADSLAQARKDEKTAEENTHGGASGRVGLNLKAKNATEAATAARAAIAQAEAVLRANGAGNLINNNSSGNNSRTANKKPTK